MSEEARHFIRFQMPAILWAAVIFVASSIPASKLPRFVHLINDKVIHFSIFFLLGILVYRALEPKVTPAGFDWRRLVIAISAVILYGISDEFHQVFVPGRTVDAFDALADSLGGVSSALFIWLNYRRKPSAA
jgi:VanZ family protein